MDKVNKVQRSVSAEAPSHTHDDMHRQDIAHSHTHDEGQNHVHSELHSHGATHSHTHDEAQSHVHDEMHSHGAAHSHTYDEGQSHVYGEMQNHKHNEAHGHSHSHTQTKAVLNRLSRIIGHLESVKRMVEQGRDCSEVLVQLAAVDSAVKGVSRVVMKDHIEHCLVEAVKMNDHETLEKLNEAIDRFIK